MPIATQKYREKEIDPSMDIISPPLPLPIHFDLLPTLAPGKTLCPVFYILIDKIPIYLTLDPSNTPHLSLLPIFLTLHPISPLSILSTLHFKPKDYSLTLNGIAPYLDIWVPLNIARIVCKSLGLERLFWDENDPTRGLLSKIMEEVNSWDDGPAIGHNWLPPSSQLPKSAYSLSTLLSTPLTGIDIIQDNRYITTSLDVDTKHQLMRDAKTNNPSRIRGGNWAEIWDGIIILSDLAWKEFLLHPSVPKSLDIPSHISLTNPKESKIVHAILPLIPSLIYPQSTLPTYPFTLEDLQALFEPKPKAIPAPPPEIGLTSIISSFITSSKAKETTIELEEKRYKARLGICLSEFIGDILVSSFQTQFLNDRYDVKRGRKSHKESRHSEKGVYIFVEKPDHPDFYLHKSDARDEKKKKSKSRDRHNKDEYQHKDHWDETIEILEKQRRSSPPRDEHQTSKSARSTSLTQKKTSSSPFNDTKTKPISSTFETQSSVPAESQHIHKPKHVHKREYTGNSTKSGSALSTSSSSSSESSESEGESGTTGTPPTVHSRSTSNSTHSNTNKYEYENERENDSKHPENPPHFGIIESIDQFPLGDWNWSYTQEKDFNINTKKKSRIMLSENKDGWQPYKGLLFAILLGWFLGYCQVF